MAKYNEKLIVKLNNIADNLTEDKVCKIASEILVKNIKKNTNDMLKKGNSQWHYDYHGSFSNDDTYNYLSSEKVLEINHPAVKRLEYGQKKDLHITPKRAKKLSYIGNDGTRWFSEYENIPKSSFPPLGFVNKSIKETVNEVRDKIKGIINGN